MTTPSPSSRFKVSVNVRVDHPVRLELRLDDHVADVVLVQPGEWKELKVPARTERATARFARLDLRLLDADQTAIWITKVQPIQ